MTKLTVEEVSSWPALGPVTLDPKRVLDLIKERDAALAALKIAQAHISDGERLEASVLAEIRKALAKAEGV